MTVISRKYALQKNLTYSAAIGLFNGFFFTIFQMNQVVGNLLSSILLDQFQIPIYVLLYVFLGIAAFSFVSLCFLTPEIDETREKDTDSLKERIFKTLRTNKDKMMLLLVPAFIYSGVEQGFLFGDFTRDIINATIGSNRIGYVMAVFGIVNVASAFASGKIFGRYGTIPLIATGLIAQLIVLLGFLFFILFADNWVAYIQYNSFILYIAAGIYGIGDSIWNNITNIMVSKLFPEKAEAAFSNSKFWQGFGFVIPFVWNVILDTRYKLAFVAVHCIIQSFFLTILERRVIIRDETEEKNKSNTTIFTK